jgi:methylene-fatty-acyl-phospholipid synthase
VLLSAERIFYVWLTRAPWQFRRLCRSVAAPVGVDPLTGVRALFLAFKAIQVGVFGWWCLVFGGGHVDLAEPAVSALGAAAVVAGQFLNVSVFGTLGPVGVFYGGQLGYGVPRRDEFPFSVFKHPQYVGAVLTIWGAFLILRFPHADWWVLPALETAYYSLGARFERMHPDETSEQEG